ncbi:AraC family transcriptional regulator [Alkalibacterium sp. m-11]|uniref:AraC family transcriptional regulator n=1 Tax=Alkalibacterium indicireducens TaxID=398758 RepID=A0ABN1AIJ1_9LACT
MFIASENYGLSRLSRQLNYVSSGHKPPKSHEWGPGVRDIYAMHYIIKGKGIYKTRSGEYELKAGQSFLIYPYTEIYYYPDPNDPWEYVWVEFTGEEVAHILDLTSLSAGTPITEKAESDLSLYYFLEENKEKSVAEAIRMAAKLRTLLSYYIEQFPEETRSEKNDYVQQAKDTIFKHYWKALLTVTDIVEDVNIERSYLFRLFKASTGLPISTYLRDVRIEQACLLMQKSNLSVKSIANSVGYSDPLCFSKVFKKVKSYTPTEYIALTGKSNEKEHSSRIHGNKL